MIEATDGVSSSKIQLSDRFQHLIDTVAMRRDMAGTDAYLEGFEKGPPTEISTTPEEAVSTIKENLENNFEEIAKTALEEPGP